MKEQLISFETAKLAKEKGFDIVQSNFYDEKTTMLCYGDTRNYNTIKNCLSTPTQSLLQRWLREKYDIFVETQTYLVDGLFKHMFIIKTTMDYEIDVRDSGNNFPSLEKALEKGLQEALKALS